MPPLSIHEVPVEILELTPHWLAGGLAASFARVQILVTYYDGDPARWREEIERGQMPGDESDVEFLNAIEQRMQNDPTLLADMRRIVSEFAGRVGSVT
ncbi:MAG TPA: hypothetical protein VND45_11335 [Thermoanaerobaculia bacterium]|nr:hypothetical protein [Thermoanaerobaculia bacterium]